MIFILATLSICKEASMKDRDLSSDLAITQQVDILFYSSM
jgi:hypothetical protein